MSRFQLLSHFKRSQDRPDSRLSEVWAIFDTNKMRVILIACVAVLGLMYLGLVNSSATSGFYLSDLETHVFELEDEYQHLVLEETELTSLAHLQDQSKQMQMVASGRVDYATGDTSVALVGTE